MYRRCEKHNLAAGPDGKCALCRRTDPAAFPDIEIEESGWVRRGITALLSLATLVAIGLTIWWVKSPGQSPLNPSYLQRDSALRGMGYNYEELDKAADAAMTRGDGLVDRTEAASTAPSKTKTGRETEEARPLTEEEKARREVPITIYATSECPVSARARAYMQRMQFEFKARDIYADADARARMEKINPALSTPTFEVEGEVLLGFGEKKLLEAIDRAIIKRQERRERQNRRQRRP